VTVRALNARLARYGKKFGPDPASEAACTVGGVIANNSSGMHCGTTDNAYMTLESLTVVLASGTVIDTGASDADERLRHLEPALYQGLAGLADRVRNDPVASAAVRRQFSMKNTMGYGLNSFLDHDRPAHIATGLLLFPSLEAANSALPAIVDTGAATVELMDSLSLRVGQELKDTPAAVKDLIVRDHTALLVEYAAMGSEILAEKQHQGAAVLDRLDLASPLRFTRDVAEGALRLRGRRPPAGYDGAA
jgi:D-lactate dehydrogenase